MHASAAIPSPKAGDLGREQRVPSSFMSFISTLLNSAVRLQENAAVSNRTTIEHVISLDSNESSLFLSMLYSAQELRNLQNYLQLKLSLSILNSWIGSNLGFYGLLRHSGDWWLWPVELICGRRWFLIWPLLTVFSLSWNWSTYGVYEFWFCFSISLSLLVPP